MYRLTITVFAALLLSAGASTAQVEDARNNFESEDMKVSRVESSNQELARQNAPEIHLKTLGGYYLSVDQGGGGPVHARTKEAGRNETFTLIDLDGNELSSGNQVNIKTTAGNLVFASPDGTVSSIHFINPDIKNFTIIRALGKGNIQPGDLVLLRSSSGKYVSAINGGGEAVNAKAIQPQFEEAFVMTAIANENPEDAQESAQQSAEDQPYVISRTILEDGTVKTVYSDGSIVKRFPGGTIILTDPDGFETILSLMQGQTPTLPPHPDEIEEAWLGYQADKLLGMMGTLVGGDETSISMYLETEKDISSMYEKIEKRLSTISYLINP